MVEKRWCQMRIALAIATAIIALVFIASSHGLFAHLIRVNAAAISLWWCSPSLLTPLIVVFHLAPAAFVGWITWKIIRIVQKVVNRR